MTTDQVRSALEIMLAVADAIRQGGRVPEGTLYATLMGRMSLAAFESMTRQLIATGLIRRDGNELVWVG